MRQSNKKATGMKQYRRTSNMKSVADPECLRRGRQNQWGRQPIIWLFWSFFSPKNCMKELDLGGRVPRAS